MKSLEDYSKRMNFGVTIAVALVICATNPPASTATQGNFAATGIGGRSSIFDEAFVAVADDASALYWNPAGISRLRNRYNATLSHTSPFSNLFGFWGIQHNFQSFAFSNKSLGVGVSLDMLRTGKIIESDEFGEIISTNFGYSEYKTSASFGKELRRIVSVGATLNYYKIQDINDLGLDMGILIPNNRSTFRVGAVVRNISTLDDMPCQYSVGFALQLLKALRFANAYSISEKIHKFASAVEFYQDWDKIALKLYSGLEYYPNTSDNFVWKLGGTINLSNLGLNYSFERHRFLQYSHRVTLDFGYGKYETTVSVSSLKVKKLENDTETEVEEYQSTDKIRVLVDIPKDIQSDDLKQEPIVLEIAPNYYELKSPKIEKPGPFPYDFTPTQDWFPKRGFLKEGKYIVTVYIKNKLEKTVDFSLVYNKQVKSWVDEAYNEIVARNLEKAEQSLINAVKMDPSYPTTYYVAGLLAEFSQDFAGAKFCYDEAAKLNNYDILKYGNEEIDIRQIANSDYLKKLSEGQKDRQRGIYEKLKEASGQR
ncbi:UPF0164 family protein [Candidatus Poribacteria bacterium]|nr:UPF0164 family protein [Candidatus Poribacteria bacterium]